MNSRPQTTLLEFEKNLRPSLREVSLIGEIPLSDDDALKIQQALRGLIASTGPEYATYFLRYDAPYTLACFLVWKGIQGYHEGNYWSEVRQPIGLPQANWPQKWGEIFEEVIRQSRLADFQDVKGHRFVARILLHGGIPASCLPDFFDNVIGPAGRDSFGYSENAPDLIHDFLSSSRTQATDRPVQRFLENGGKVAVDFVQRCMDLAFQADSVEPSSSGEEFGLPPYVVEQFFAWWEKISVSQPHTFRRTDRPRYRAPQIFLGINQGGLSFSFLAQRIPRNALSDTRELRLEVQQDGERVTYPLYGTRTGEMIETDQYGDTLRLREKYEFTLFAGTTSLRRWPPFSGLSSKQPWLIFHGPSEKLLPGRVITERDIWIVFPTSWTIDPTPSVRVLEEAAFTRGFQAKRLLIEGHPPDIWFTDGDGKSVSVPVKWRDIPTLQPASPETWPRLSSEEADREFTVYCGRPPRLLIPRSIPDHAFLTITPVGHSYPTERKKIRLQDLSVFSPQDDDLTLALDDPDLLGPTPWGRFILQVRSRLGKDTTFRLCLLPEVQFDFPRSVLLPDPETDSQTISFSLAHPHLEELDVELPAEQSYDGNSYRVEVPADSRRHVDVTLHLAAGEAWAEVPLAIPVSPLRWAVSGLDEGETLEWRDIPVPIALQDLEEAQEVRLMVRGDFGQAVACILSLEGADQSESFWVRNGTGGARFSPFLDSLRASGRSRNEFSLTFSLPDENSARRICPVRIDTTWLVENLRIIQDFTPDKDERRLVFRWRDSGNVKNRAFRLWRLDRQVEEPIEVVVEDSRSKVEFRRTLADFPHGLYRLELTILDEWAAPATTAPLHSDANMVFDLDIREDGITRLNSPARRLKALAGLFKQVTTRCSEVVSRLFNRLTDTDTDIRQQTVQVLEHLGVNPVALMIDQLTDEDSVVRHRAVRTLGLFASPRAIDPLIRCLADKNEGVRKQAAHTLVEMGHQAVDPLIDSLAYNDETVRQQAASTLAKLGVDATARLIVGLANPDWLVRKQAAHILGVIADSRAVQPLMQRLVTDKNKNVSKQAYYSLREMNIAVSLLHLIERLSDADADVREQAAYTLGQLGDPRAIAPLRFLLDSPNPMTWKVREAANQALAQLEDKPRQRRKKVTHES